jgi:hypothetical protein
MVNITETEIIAEKELLRLLHQYGVRLGEKTKNMWENGQISDSGGRIVIIAEEIRNIKPSVPGVTKLFAKFGTPESGTIGNGLIVCAGAYTGSRSAVGYGLTSCSTAKGFYAASAVFSAAAITNGGMAIMANVCSISRAGVLTEALGLAFMKVGELAHVAALQAEGKLIPQRLQYLEEWSRKTVRRPYGNNGNLGFIMPGVGSGDFSFLSETIAKIPFKQIGQLVGLSLTLYGYSKIVVTGYRYSQKFAYKFKQARRSKLLLKQASFIVNFFNYSQNSRKIYKTIIS